MTGTQAACLKTLCAENGERFDPDLTRAAAAELIDTLKARTPRPAGAGDNPDMS